MWTVLCLAVLLLGMLVTPLAWSQTAAERQRHIEVLLAKFPDLRMVRQEEMYPRAVAAYADRLYPVKVEPGPLYGNFNGDRRKDFAALLAFRQSYRERGINSDGIGGFVVMCLSRGKKDFDCRLVRVFTVQPVSGVNMVLYTDPPKKELVFRFLGRPKIEPPGYQDVGEGELDWNMKYRRVLGVKNVGKIYGSWSTENPDASELGYLRQPYDTLVTTELDGYCFQHFWTPGLGILTCCGPE